MSKRSRRKSRKARPKRRRPTIFLSHDHCDGELAAEISEKLEATFQDRICVFCSSRPRDHARINGNVRYEEDAMKKVARHISEAIAEADSFLFLVTKKSLRLDSCLVKTEMSIAFDEVLSRSMTGSSIHSGIVYPDYTLDRAFTILLAEGARRRHVPWPQTEKFFKLNLRPSDLRAVELRPGSRIAGYTKGFDELVTNISFRYHIIDFDMTRNWRLEGIENQKAGGDGSGPVASVHDMLQHIGQNLNVGLMMLQEKLSSKQRGKPEQPDDD